MQSEWIQRVGSSVPRGFSRHFILETLKKKPHTGIENIEFAIKQTEGKWKPSPNLIYPLLGRLLDEKLIQETTGGKYKITKKGSTTTDDFETINNIVKNQLDVLFRIGNLGRFVALDMLERISTLGTVLSENAATTAPISWKIIYPIPSATLIFFVIIIGIVTAGLKCAQDI